FQGGLAGLWGYDLCQVVEKLPRHRYDEFQAPEFAVGVYDWVMAWDGVAERGWLISTGVGEASTGRLNWSAAARAEQVRRQLRQRVIEQHQHEREVPKASVTSSAAVLQDEKSL